MEARVMKLATRLIRPAAILLLLTAAAYADDASSSKREVRYYAAAGKTYNMHANDHARMLGKFAAATNQPVPAEVVREHTAAIRANVSRAKQSFAKLGDAAQNPKVAAQLAEIQKRLAAVTKQVDTLESEKDVDAKAVLAATADISADLKATHDSGKAIDTAINEALANDEQSDEFADRQASDYYFTGEGHFID
jgi:cytochrome c556